jgi:hypothetical protein
MDQSSALGFVTLIAGWIAAYGLRRSRLVRELRFIRISTKPPADPNPAGTPAEVNRRKNRQGDSDGWDSWSFGDSDHDGDSGGGGGSD